MSDTVPTNLDVEISQTPVDTSVVPKVFISYSWSNSEHVAWVLDLAKRLMNDGIAEVVLDRWDLKPGQDKFHFMEQMVIDESIHKVLIICDMSYSNKADERKGGVGTETQIINPAVYNSVSQNKFIPVVIENDAEGSSCLPVYLKNRIFIDFSDPLKYFEKYEDLVREIIGKPLLVKPKLGNRPSYLMEAAGTQLSTTYKLDTLKAAIHRGTTYAYVAGLLEDYLEVLEQILAGMEIIFDSPLASDQAVEAKIKDSIEVFLPYRDEYIDCVSFVSKYADDVKIYEVIQRFFVRCTLLFKRPFSDNYHFLLGELFLYTLAILIRNEQFEAVLVFLTPSYSNSEDENNDKYRTYSVFRPMMPYMEQAPSGQYKSVKSRLNERVRTNKVSWVDLVNADYALYIRDFIRETRNQSVPWCHLDFSGHWFSYAPPSVPLFQRTKSVSYFNKFARVLDVRDKEDLFRRIENACERLSGQGKNILDWHQMLLDIDRLATIT